MNMNSSSTVNLIDNIVYNIDGSRIVFVEKRQSAVLTLFLLQVTVVSTGYSDDDDDGDDDNSNNVMSQSEFTCRLNFSCFSSKSLF